MTEIKAVPTAPSWLGFHRDGLIVTLALDCLWMVLEVAATATVVGIPAVPFIAFMLFGVSAWIVFSKQRQLGDSYIQATWKSIVLGAIAGVPYSIFGGIVFGILGLLRALLQQYSKESPPRSHSPAEGVTSV